MKKLALLLFVSSMIWSCGKVPPSAQKIVNRAISASGLKAVSNASATFNFRNIRYTYDSKDGKYTYTRVQTDTLNNKIKDVLTNDGLKRFINEQEAQITEKKRSAYSASVNSVIYFAFLPASLNDAAVNKAYVGTVVINDKNYYKIKVTFDSEGGGEDFEDVFYYWFDTEDYSMDYLAYSYNEDHGKGIRFRVAYNTRKVNGIVIQDYKNLKPTVKDSVPLESIDQAYQEGKLSQLSLIELEDVVISTQ